MGEEAAVGMYCWGPKRQIQCKCIWRLAVGMLKTGYLSWGHWRPSVQPLMQWRIVSTLWNVGAKVPGNKVEEKLLDVEAREWRANLNNMGFPGEEIK